nr:hypothetical protein [Eubacterium sp.]
MLKGEVRKICEFSEEELVSMYGLMAQFYDDTEEEVFRKDFQDKDYCLVLYREDGKIIGFTTQKIMSLDVEGKEVKGVFSGDTIIHKDYWGETELFKVWANFWFPYAKEEGELYWFLICKGYKTYRILPVFWKEFYPNYRCETPEEAKRIIDAYASQLYPEEYNPETGVVEYKRTKDKLKSGVADIGERELRNKDIAFFCEKNPDYVHGNDIACLAKIDMDVLRKGVRETLFHECTM